MRGIFTISLDFELHWGVFDKRSRVDREVIYRNTLRLIPELLKLFTDYEVRVTWASVGSLFARDVRQWNELRPVIEPAYREEKYSAYKWVEQNGLEKEFQWAHFSPDIIAAIQQYPGQELASHTFSHYYCCEEQDNPNAFDADLKAAQKAAALFNTELCSLVFPRNQVNTDLLKVCYANGIKTVRSTPSNWYWNVVDEKNSSKLLRKIMRTGDAYIKLSPQRMSYPLSRIEAKEGEPLQLPASRFLRPWRSQYRFANRWRTRRLCTELRDAAIHNECYHLWWHPENFGEHPEENIEGLRILLNEYQKCKTKYGMTSWNMSDYIGRI